MECCLLCLADGKEFVDRINVNSERWNKQNMKYLIEKHLWPMETINMSSWLCSNCGQELYDFHKFYTRIEEAHKDLSAFVKTEYEKENINIENENENNNYNCNEISEKDLVECHLEPEIVMEQLMGTDFGVDITCIKTENIDDVGEEEVTLKRSGKKCVLMKDVGMTSAHTMKDPLGKTKKYRHTKISSRKPKKLKATLKSSTEKVIVALELDKKSVIPEPESAELHSGADDNKKLHEEDTDSERNDYVENTAIKKSSKAHKRRNPDEKTLKEYDRIIAENFQIVCTICQTPFENFIALRRHFKGEHKQRGYARCCNRNFFTRSVLVDHIYVHLNPEHFKCQDCGKIFSDRSTLVCHTKLHMDGSELERCDKCGKAFVNSAALRTHLLTHSSEKMFPCAICGKFFTNSSILNHHVEAVHQNKFVQICDICGKSIRCPTAFASHMENHKVKTIPISCDICGLLLSNKEGLKRHRNSQHPEGGKKEHKCHICLKVSPTQRALKSHIQRTHEMGYDYKCTLCEKAFKRPAVLREHMATHTGTALYNCPWCPKTFISNGNMYNHRKNAHPKEWEELQRQKYVEKLT